MRFFQKNRNKLLLLVFFILIIFGVSVIFTLINGKSSVTQDIIRNQTGEIHALASTIDVTQDPENPAYQEAVNITARITNSVDIQSVYIETNYTGTFSNYTMSLLSGSLQDGTWNFTFDNYPLNKNITYRIFLRDILNETNSTSQFNFGVYDTSIPNIKEVTQDPTVLAYQDKVNVTAHIADNFEIQTVLIETNYTHNYMSEHNFTEDLNGGDPSGWTISEPSNTYCNVIAEKDGHYKVVELYDNSSVGCPKAINYFPLKVSGSVEVWIEFSDVYETYVGVPSLRGELSIKIYLYVQNGYLMYRSSSDHQICPLNNNNFYHFKIDWNSTGWQVAVDGTIYGSGYSYNFYNPLSSGIDNVYFTTINTNFDYYMWIDAVDYSWADGYYLNRNVDPINVNFSMTRLSGSMQDGVWNYTFDEYPLNKQITYQIHATDILNNTNSTEQFNFGVYDTSIPNIIEVTQDPPAENITQYWVNVTARITDNFEVQIVYMEANYTGTYVNYTMALLSGTYQDGVWSYIFDIFPPNERVTYRIFAVDIIDNENVTNYFNFGLYDTNPPNISISQIPSELAYLDSINVTAHISDNTQIDTVYFSSNASCDYYGYFSFNFDANGANPADWAVMEQSGTKLEVQELKAGHRKVVYFELDRDYSFSSPCEMEYDVWRSVTYGTIEFWVYIAQLPEWNSGSRDPVFRVRLISSVNDAFVLSFLERENKICYGIGGVSTWYDTNATWKKYQWQHYRIVFDGPSGIWDLYQDGVLIANDLPCGVVGSYQYYTFGYESTHSSGQKGKVWIDAVDFSWEWFYYLNRNMDYDQYNYTMTQLSGSLQDGIWNFTLTEYPIQKLITYQVYASDIAGNLNFPERSTGTFDYTAPAIETVIQDPTVPTYQDSVNVTVHITENFEVQDVFIETNSSSIFQNYTMTLRNGSLQDGFWVFKFDSYPLNKYIAYRVFAGDFLGHWNSTTYFIFGVFDTNVPNITEVTQDPAIPVYQDKVNITVYVTDNFEIQTVVIETNHTVTFMNYTMSLLSGTTQDGTWNFTFGSYPLNEYVAYRIFAVDICNNTNATDYLYFGVFDFTGPNIMNIGQIPNPPDYINITAVITEYTQVQEVLLEANHTGIFTNYSMTLLGGSLQDGVWNFTVTNYPLNTYIAYRIFTGDILNNTNATNYFYFGVFDFDGPNITNIIQDPIAPIYLEKVNITAVITEYTQVQEVLLETNHTGIFANYSMTLLGGSLKNGLWNFTFNSYPLNTSITYRLHAIDICNNTNATNYFYFGVFDFDGPNIKPSQASGELIYQLFINISAHITEYTELQMVNIEINYTGTFVNYTMTLLSGSVQDGIWNFTLFNYSLNTFIAYRIFTQDIVGNRNSTEYFSIYVDSKKPNIEFTQDPFIPIYPNVVNITAHIIENSQIQVVYIETDYNGTFTNYSMTLVSGTIQDGTWNFTFTNYPLNTFVLYRIIAIDIVNNTNSSVYWSFYVDAIVPNIVEITQTPYNFTILQPVNVTAHILDNYVIVSAVIESNYTGSWTNQSMLYLSGTAEDSYWQFIFDAYPVNEMIWYRIHASDATGNTTISNFYKFGIFPIISWDAPSELELEINLKDREGVISFLFSNTGNTTFLILNFTIDLPAGWSADQYTISIPSLAPGADVTIRFHVTVPDTNKPFEEIITIDFQAIVLETGQLIEASISVFVTGVKNRLLLWLIIIFGSVAGASTLIFINRKRKQKKKMVVQKKSPLKPAHQKLQPDGELVVVKEPKVPQTIEVPEKAPVLSHKNVKKILEKLKKGQNQFWLLIKFSSLGPALSRELNQVNEELNKIKSRLEQSSPSAEIKLEVESSMPSEEPIISSGTLSVRPGTEIEVISEHLNQIRNNLVELLKIIPQNTKLYNEFNLIMKKISRIKEVLKSSQ